MPDDVIISDEITIPATEIEVSAIRAQGAGGQNVNKVSSAIHLRFDIARSSALPERVRDKLLALGDRRVTDDGILVIKAQEFRSQEKNRRAALDRLQQIVQSATIEPKPRKRTKPSKRAREQRLQDKRRRSQVKRDRSKIDRDS